jgi:uncharacterized protein YoxC
MNTKYNTVVDVETPVKEPEVTREINKLEEEIKVLNHLVTDLLAKRLKPVLKQVDKTVNETASPREICLSSLGKQIQNMSNSVGYVSDVVNEILEDIEI